MKTFDEALTCIGKQGVDKIRAELHSHQPSLFANPSMIALITKWKEELIRKIPEQGTYLQVEAVICASLNVAFNLGLLIGIEMEKPE